MTITAKFSNGFEDTYKGTRAVKAAWAIIRKADGEVLNSGHSMDRAKAATTARGNLRYCATATGVDMPLLDVPQRLYAGANYGWLYERAAKHGFTGKGMSAYKAFAKAHNAKRQALIEAAVAIEIVDL